MKKKRCSFSDRVGATAYLVFNAGDNGVKISDIATWLKVSKTMAKKYLSHVEKWGFAYQQRYTYRSNATVIHFYTMGKPDKYMGQFHQSWHKVKEVIDNE